jgi:hypothetical protein
MVSLLTALRSAQDALGRLKVSPDAIPEVPASTLSVLRVLAEYSHRGAEALARYGLRQAE